MILPAGPVVRLRRASLVLGGRTVLRDAELSLAPGEFVGLIGANGAGKTTLLRAILGLLPPAAGSIEVLGQPARPGCPGIGYLPQHGRGDAALRLSGQAFVAAAAGGARWGLPIHSRAEAAAVDRAIDLVDGRALARRQLGALSGGERQLLLLAQALLGGDPRLLLLDEPLVGLDPPAQARIVSVVRDLQRSLGLCVLFSAHELNPVLPAMDRVLSLAGGRAAIAPAAEAITGPVLSAVYGAPIAVVRSAGRLFVLPAGGADVPASQRIPA